MNHIEVIARTMVGRLRTISWVEPVAKRLNSWWLTRGWVLEIVNLRVEGTAQDNQRLPGKYHMSAKEEIREIRARRNRIAVSLSYAGWVVVFVVSVLLVLVFRLPAEYAFGPIAAGCGWTGICFFGEKEKADRNMKLRRLQSGMQAESRVADALYRDFSPLNVLLNVELENKCSRTGTTEFDFIVFGNKAVYLVEVKTASNYRTIVGRPDGWRIRTMGIGDEKMRDPISQVRVQRSVLSKALQRSGIKDVKIKPMVMLAARFCDVELSEDEKIPVFESDLDQMLDYIDRNEKGGGKDLPGDILTNIRALTV